MHRNEIGNIVAGEWERTAQIRKNVQLDEWVVMPNHVHGIVVIEEPSVETTRRVVSTTIKPDSLGSIIGQFKSIATKRARTAGYPDFAWQPRYYDHIIRNDKSLKKIQDYIMRNPAMWEFDKNNSTDYMNWI